MTSQSNATHQLEQVFGARHSPVIIGNSILADSAAIIWKALAGHKVTGVMIVIDANLQRTHPAWASVVTESITSHGAFAGKPVHTHAIEASEANKSVASWQAIMEECVRAKLDRHCLIVAIGGGIVTDIGGFAAATFLRGVRWVAIPTTLLGMVDAALGGKTGINIALGSGGLGKNLAGAFCPPEAVISDVATLSTLPERVLISGLAECLKHAILSDWSMADQLGQVASMVKSSAVPDKDRLSALIAQCAATKLKVVAEDPHEASTRKLLNLGHTFGHAIESELHQECSHGEAVALGLVAAAHAAAAADRISSEQAHAIAAKVASLGLPTRLPREIAMVQLVRAVSNDKKASGGAVWLVLPRANGGADVVADPDGRLLAVGLRAIGALDFK